MKWFAHMSIICIYKTYARLPRNVLHKIQSWSINSQENPLVINPDGPLNILRGYTHINCGFTHNKRFFSPDLNIDYRLDYDGNIKPGSNYESLQEPTCWSDPEQEYRYDYHRVFLNMFKLLEGRISVVDPSITSFYHLLESNDAPRILACLFLLSEGVDLPLNSYICDDMEYMVLSSSSGNGFSAQVLREHDKEGLVLSHKAKAVIEFFKKYCSRWADEKALKRDAVDDFSSGNFLDEPNFHIQSFIYEYFENENELSKFIQNVYENLNAIIGDTERNISTLESSSILSESNKEAIASLKATVSQYNKLMKDCFNSSCNINSLYMEAIDIPHKFYPSKFFFLPDHREILQKGRHFVFHRNSDRFVEEKFYTPLEEEFLGLFLCFLYDPETNEYSARKLPNPSLDLQFFLEAYSEPLYNSFNQSFQKDWTRVIQDLPCEAIQYIYEEKGAKWNLFSGIFNYLRLIAEIAGLPSVTKETIENWMSIHRELCKEDKLVEEVKSFIITLFSELSIMSVEVSFENLHLIQKRHKGTLDMHGSIVLRYRYRESIHIVTLSLGYLSRNIMHTTEEICSLTKEIDELTGIHHDCMNMKTLMGFLASKNIQRFLDEITYRKFPSQVLQRVIDTKNLNEVLIDRKIDTMEARLYIIDVFIPYLNDSQGLDTRDKIVRFTSNVLGSFSYLSSEHYDSIVIRFIVSLRNGPAIFHKINSRIINRMGNPKFDLASIKLACRIKYSCNMPNLLLFFTEKYLAENKDKKIVLATYSLVFHMLPTLVRNDCHEMIDILRKHVFAEHQTGLHSRALIWLIHACNAKCIQEIEYIFRRLELYKVPWAGVWHYVKSMFNYLCSKFCEKPKKFGKNIFNLYKQVRMSREGWDTLNAFIESEYDNLNADCMRKILFVLLIKPNKSAPVNSILKEYANSAMTFLVRLAKMAASKECVNFDVLDFSKGDMSKVSYKHEALFEDPEMSVVLIIKKVYSKLKYHLGAHVLSYIQ